jgi:lactoylglutathione lyase
VKLDHVAIWVVDIESMRTFYEKYFDARSNLKYENERQRFSSYFLTFTGGGRRGSKHRNRVVSGSRYRQPHSMSRGDEACPSVFRPC